LLRIYRRLRRRLGFADTPIGTISPMPSLFRFLISTGSLVALVSAGLYILADQFEPQRHEVVKVVPGVKIRKP
jgi:hypothetical protein